MSPEINNRRMEGEIKWIKAAWTGYSLTSDDLAGVETSIICFTQQERVHDELAVLSLGKMWSEKVKSHIQTGHHSGRWIT